MKKNVFAIYDSKSEIYLPPIMFLNINEAVRWFGDVVKDPKSMICSHPEDYTLFHIGSFDDSTGKYEQELTHKSLGIALEYVAKNSLTPQLEVVK